MKIDFGRWTTTKAALAVAGALAIGGAVGSAVAISPTLSVPIKWGGGVEFDPGAYGQGSFQLYLVPAGRNLLLTDLIMSNLEDVDTRISIFSSVSNCGETAKNRLTFVLVPAGETLNFPLVTGIGFAAGQRVCLNNSAATTLSLNGRGFLFTPN